MCAGGVFEDEDAVTFDEVLDDDDDDDEEEVERHR